MLKREYEHQFILTWRSWLETFILSIAILAAFRFIDPRNPFLLHDVFPWLLIVPIYVALQYRIGPTLLSASIIFGAFYFHYGAQTFTDPYNKVFFIIGIVFVLACNQIGSLWILRIRRAEQTAYYVNQRLRQLTNDFYTISFSHSRLEQLIMFKQTSLREAITEIRLLLIDNDGKLNKSICHRLMNLLVANFQFSKAQLYLFHKGKLDTNPISSLGPQTLLNINDTLIKRALQNKSTYYYSVNQLGKQDESEYLAAIPLLTTNQQMLGLFVIEEMDFLSLNKENLVMLGVVLKFFGDELSDIKETLPLVSSFPDCPLQFARDLIIMQNMYYDLKIDSTLTVLYITVNEENEEIIQCIISNLRSLDQIWLHSQKNQNTIKILFILMPFTNRQGAATYTERIKKMLAENFISYQEKEFIQFKYAKIRDNDLKLTIEDFITSDVN